MITDIDKRTVTILAQAGRLEAWSSKLEAPPSRWLPVGILARRKRAVFGILFFGTLAFSHAHGGAHPPGIGGRLSFLETSLLTRCCSVPPFAEQQQTSNNNFYSVLHRECGGIGIQFRISLPPLYFYLSVCVESCRLIMNISKTEHSNSQPQLHLCLLQSHNISLHASIILFQQSPPWRVFGYNS